jgi:SET and MYND domain-containing protein
LDAIGHGIFPQASRSFNHSCRPNALARYIFIPTGIRQDIIALRDIDVGEEASVIGHIWAFNPYKAQITISYLDPATPFFERQQNLQAVYGFRCICELCTFQSRVAPKLSTVRDASASYAVEQELVKMGDETISFETFPSALLSSFESSFLPSLTEDFSRSSHNGEFLKAVEKGEALRGVYHILYPSMHPVIGESTFACQCNKAIIHPAYHELELSKTMWNCIASNSVSPSDEGRILRQSKKHLDRAAEILRIVGGNDELDSWERDVKAMEEVLTSA